MPEVQARRRLGSRVTTLSVLAPVGSVAGKGTLRVLRVSPARPEADAGESVALTCGYDSYDFDALAGRSSR
jgi:hypothetical protein